jgi:hypothetical protein
MQSSAFEPIRFFGEGVYRAVDSGIEKKGVELSGSERGSREG